MSDMLTTAEQAQIQQSIATAELKTTGEIRVHIERKCSTDPLVKATKLFVSMGMDKTINRNAALIYLATEDHKVAIVGDVELNKVVPSHFWDDECALMISHFKQGKLVTGLCAGIEEVGKELAMFFPAENDEINELTNDISFGND